MSKGEYCSKWLRILEKSRQIIHHEFSSLSDVQMNYHVHIHNCSIAEILDNLVTIQNKIIVLMDRHVDCLEKTPGPEEYRPGLSPLIIRLSLAMNCKPVKTGKMVCIGELTQKLYDQSIKLESLIRLTTGCNINKRMIGYGFLNIVRISMGDGFEFITKCQQKHVILARRILMLQNL